MMLIDARCYASGAADADMPLMPLRQRYDTLYTPLSAIMRHTPRR